MSEELETTGGEEISDPVLEAGALMIKYGSDAPSERALHKNFPSLTSTDVQDIIQESRFRLIGSAPKEIRGSFEAVISYHRWNHMYVTAMSARDVKAMTEAQKQIDNLIARVH